MASTFIGRLCGALSAAYGLCSGWRMYSLGDEVSLKSFQTFFRVVLVRKSRAHINLDTLRNGKSALQKQSPGGIFNLDGRP